MSEEELQDFFPPVRASSVWSNPDALPDFHNGSERKEIDKLFVAATVAVICATLVAITLIGWVIFK